MIAIRRNLSSAILSPNSLLRNSKLHFSTWKLRKLIPDPEIYDVLVHKHNFTPDLASRASSTLRPKRCPERVDSILSFLKENGFTTTQLERLVLSNPRILGFSVERLKLKLGVFQDLGLSPEEIAKMMTSNSCILNSSMENKIIPSLSKLKGLLPSTQHVAELLRKLPWFVRVDLDRKLIPNVEILKSFDIPTDRIFHFLYRQPRCFCIKPDIMRRSVAKAIEIGPSSSSFLFIRAVAVLASSNEGIWELKLQTFRDMGFSDVDIFAMFRKAPLIFCESAKKMLKAIELLLANGRYSISDIVNNPVSLGCSIEKRLEPRLQILGLLESMNLMKKWPGLSIVAGYTDDRFIDRFIRPYMDEIGNEYVVKKYVEGKKKKKRNEALRACEDGFSQHIVLRLLKIQRYSDELVLTAHPMIRIISAALLVMLSYSCTVHRELTICFW